jgi:hypothetical protein
MKVLVALPDSDTHVYLEGLNGFKSAKCEPKINDNLAVFELSLTNFYECGLIRVVNKLTVSGRNRERRDLIDFMPLFNTFFHAFVSL